MWVKRYALHPTTLKADLPRQLRQLCKKAREEEDPRELARLFKEIDDGLSVLSRQLEDILAELENVIRTKGR
jgi:hypothetical protein